MINRINDHVYTNDYINKNQYGFTPQLSSIDAAMAVKDLVEIGFSSGEVATLVSLDVEGAFNSAWRPNILKSLKEIGCPRNLYNLTSSYFSQRKRPYKPITLDWRQKLPKASPRVMLWPWPVESKYNSLLNLN